MILRMIIIFSFLCFLSGCLPALAAECGKLCSNAWWKNATIEELKVELKLLENINDTNSWGWTPLHYAAKEGNPKHISLILDANAKINAQCKNGNTPLHIAASNAKEQNAITLIDAGSNIKIKNTDGNTPFMMIKENNKLKDLKIFEK